MSARRDDDERDAHLRAALRHAPDHDAAPPATLSEQILAAARRSVQPARDRSSWVRRVRVALASMLDVLARPAGAAAFASLVLATVIGVMWREGTPPEALPERAPRPVTAEPAPSSEPPPMPAQAPSPSPSPAQAPSPAPAAPAQATTQTLSKPAGEAPAVARARALQDVGAAKPPAAELKRGNTMPSSTDTRPAQRSQAAQPLGESSASADAAPAEASARGEARKAATAPAPAEARPPPRAAPMTAAPAAPAGLRSSLASAAPDPLAGVVAELAREAAGAPPAATHRWQRGGAPALPHGPTAQAWLAELQRAAQGMWRPSQGATPPGANALVLSNERGVVAHLELTDAGVLWHSTSAPNLIWRAALPDETLKRLRESLAAWAGR